MDRFFYYLLGGIAAIVLIIGLGAYVRNRTPVEANPAVAAATPVPSPAPDKPFTFGKVEMPPVAAPGASPSLLDLPPISGAATPIAAPTPLPWSPPNFGKIANITYPGFTVVYSVTLGNPLAVQYAMVGGAKPRRWPDPTKVPTPNPKLLAAAGYSAGTMALSKSIGLYFGKQAGHNADLMVNVCAFYPQCLAGPWAQFSDLEAKWAGEAGWIEVVAGPVFGSPPSQAGGIVVPVAFYRAYRRSYGDTIAFLIPQTAVEPALDKYLTSISAIEAATGMSIFPNTISLEERNNVARALW